MARLGLLHQSRSPLARCNGAVPLAMLARPAVLLGLAPALFVYKAIHQRQPFVNATACLGPGRNLSVYSNPISSTRYDV